MLVFVTTFSFQNSYLRPVTLLSLILIISIPYLIRERYFPKKMIKKVSYVSGERFDVETA